MLLIGATTFCLQWPRIAHVLCSDQIYRTAPNGRTIENNKESKSDETQTLEPEPTFRKEQARAKGWKGG